MERRVGQFLQWGAIAVPPYCLAVGGAYSEGYWRSLGISFVDFMSAGHVILHAFVSLPYIALIAAALACLPRDLWEPKPRSKPWRTIAAIGAIALAVNVWWFFSSEVTNRGILLDGAYFITFAVLVYASIWRVSWLYRRPLPPAAWVAIAALVSLVPLAFWQGAHFGWLYSEAKIIVPVYIDGANRGNYVGTIGDRIFVRERETNNIVIVDLPSAKDVAIGRASVPDIAASLTCNPVAWLVAPRECFETVR